MDNFKTKLRSRCNDAAATTMRFTSRPFLSPPLRKNKIKKKGKKFYSLNLIWFDSPSSLLLWVCVDHDSYVALHSFLPFSSSNFVRFLSDCKVVGTNASISALMDGNVVLLHHHHHLLDGYMNSKYMKAFVHVSYDNICHDMINMVSIFKKKLEK